VFYIEGLKRAAKIFVNNNHGKVVSIEKLAEGSFNEIFFMLMEDGFVLVVKILYYIALSKYYATANDTATLAFLRLKDFPVPEVYDYSATF
jgi:hypothetical protein